VFQANIDVIAVVQMGFVGSWGEWYYTDYFGNEGHVTAQNQADRTSVINKLLSVLPPTRMIQLRTPAIKRAASGVSTPLDYYDNTQYVCRMGHHDDCFLAPRNDEGTYESKSDEKWAFQDTTYTNWGGETCEVDPPRSACDNAILTMTNLHSSYVNEGYNPDVIKSWKNGGCFNQISSRFGYRLAILSAALTATRVSQGFNVTGNLTFGNYGFAQPYNPRELLITFTNAASTSQSASFLIASSANRTTVNSPSTDIRTWLPTTGGASIVVPVSVLLPSSFVSGTHLNVQVLLRDPLIPSDGRYAIRLANVQTSVTFVQKTGANTLNGFQVVLP